MIIKGLKFGMLLQLSIGPLCLMVFTTANSSGILPALILVSSIAIVDALYIALAILGVTSILNNIKIQNAVKLIGSLILFVFGIDILLSVFNISLIPTLFSADINTSNIFLKGIILTASNPLTILFWGGVFSEKALNDKLDKNQLILFGLGCVLSTVIFLSFTALAGNLLGVFLPDIVLKILNILVGAIIIAFGIKMLLKINKA